MSWEPVAPDALPDRLATWLAATPGVVRVAVDGPPCARADRLAHLLIQRLPTRGRPSAHVPASSFWRDASLRFEHGRQDVESLRGWLDVAALRREVLDPVVSAGTYLPSLRDPETNRSTRAQRRRAPAGLVLVVSGSFLLDGALPFDRTIHLSLSPAARARQTPVEDAWTLPAFDTYDRDARPACVADIAVKLDDPRHPAVRGLAP